MLCNEYTYFPVSHIGDSSKELLVKDMKPILF